jgi:hypothetical protein
MAMVAAAVMIAAAGVVGVWPATAQAWTAPPHPECKEPTASGCYYTGEPVWSGLLFSAPSVTDIDDPFDCTIVYTIAWGDGSSTEVTVETLTIGPKHSYAKHGLYTIKFSRTAIAPSTPGCYTWIANSTLPDKIVEIVEPSKQVKISTQDDVEPAIETSTLEAKSVKGLGCSINGKSTPACKFTWLRSDKQSDADYKATKDTDTATKPHQYNLNQNGQHDVGHRFKLRATNTKTNATATSDVMAVGPSKKPELVHPSSAATEKLKVNRPFFNVKNVTHDPHTPANPLGDYKYDLQVSTDNTFPDGNTIAINDVAEQKHNHNISYEQISTSLTAGTTYYWRARAKVADAPGRWSKSATFEVVAASGIWSEAGDEWHWPLDNSARLSGTFREAYHAGDLGTRLHAGIDAAVCGDAVRAAMSGKLMEKPAVRLELNHPIGLRSHYLHMNSRTTLPLGTYINQGTKLGLASNVGRNVACHLHFAVSDLPETSYSNPLQYLPEGTSTTSGWTNVTDPVVSNIRLRSVADPHYAYVNGAGTTVINRTGIAGQVDIIATANDPNQGSTLAPSQVRFYINGVEALTDLTSTLLTAEDHERKYYAYRNPNTRENNRNLNEMYLLYHRWNKAGLPANAGPQTIEVRATDYNGNPLAPAPQRSITIGPDITANVQQVCEPLPQQVRVPIDNRNQGLENLQPPFNGSDQYSVTLGVNRVLANLDGPAQRIIPNGGSDTVDINVTGLIGTVGGQLTVTVRSGIVTDIRDMVTIPVAPNCVFP